MASSSSLDIFTLVIPITDLRKKISHHKNSAGQLILVWGWRNNPSVLQIFFSQLVPQAQKVGESAIDCRVLLFEVGEVGGGGDSVGHV